MLEQVRQFPEKIRSLKEKEEAKTNPENFINFMDEALSHGLISREDYEQALSQVHDKNVLRLLHSIILPEYVVPLATRYELFFPVIYTALAGVNKTLGLQPPTPTEFITGLGVATAAGYMARYIQKPLFMLYCVKNTSKMPLTLSALSTIPWMGTPLGLAIESQVLREIPTSFWRIYMAFREGYDFLKDNDDLLSREFYLEAVFENAADSKIVKIMGHVESIKHKVESVILKIPAKNIKEEFIPLLHVAQSGGIPGFA